MKACCVEHSTLMSYNRNCYAKKPLRRYSYLLWIGTVLESRDSSLP